MSDLQTPPPSEDPPLVKRRSVSQWLVLLVVWSAGLVVWGIYLVAVLYLFFKFFT
jgi:hypothetical protein